VGVLEKLLDPIRFRPGAPMLRPLDKLTRKLSATSLVQRASGARRALAALQQQQPNPHLSVAETLGSQPRFPPRRRASVDLVLETGSNTRAPSATGKVTRGLVARRWILTA